MAKSSTSQPADGPDGGAIPESAAESATTSEPSQPTTPHKQPAQSTITYIDAKTGLPVDPATVAAEQPEKETAQPKQAEKGEGERVFTQAEVEALIKDRLDRQRRRYEQLDAKGDADAGKQEAALSEQLASLQAEMTAFRTQARTAAISAAVAVEAQRQGIDAGLAAKLIDANAIELAETGAPKADSLKKALETLLTEHPNLRLQPALTAPNTARGQQAVRTDADRHRDYFTGGGGSFWQGGGVVNNDTQ